MSSLVWFYISVTSRFQIQQHPVTATEMSSLAFSLQTFPMSIFDH